MRDRRPDTENIGGSTSRQQRRLRIDGGAGRNRECYAGEQNRQAKTGGEVEHGHSAGEGRRAKRAKTLKKGGQAMLERFGACPQGSKTNELSPAWLGMV